MARKSGQRETDAWKQYRAPVGNRKSPGPWMAATSPRGVVPPPPLLRHLPELLLGAVVTCGASAAGPRLLSPLPKPQAAMHLRVVSDSAAPLTSARAAGITLVGTTNLALPVGQWPGIDGLRTLSNGVLQIQYQPHDTNISRWFFVARETPLFTDVTVSNSTGFRAAVAAAIPGTRILLAPGTYPGGFYFTDLRGASNSPIVITALDPQRPPVIQGGANGIQLSNPSWVELHNLSFQGATGNGLNIDDGGSFDTPAQHLLLRSLHVTDVGPQGNRDGIKLSGVEDFRVERCTLERWGTGGSAIDMVGCHRGIIESNLFRHTPAAAATGANGVQTKGGTQNVTIRRNRFEHAGARSVNLGGSTGLEFFRPPLQNGEEHAEAKDIIVEGNTFVGSTAPIAFVGVDGAVVQYNTIYRPERWVLRILQETTVAGFVPCRDGQFTDNIVAFHSSQWSSGGVNIGPNTAPTTFRFAGNWWYCLDNPPRSGPTLPVPEVGGVYGQSPQFRDAANGDLRLQPESPAGGVGAEAMPE